ncbi:MAG: hypothetical protein R3A44_25955 [Caldilineaceae bacterium]
MATESDMKVQYEFISRALDSQVDLLKGEFARKQEIEELRGGLE